VEPAPDGGDVVTESGANGNQVTTALGPSSLVRACPCAGGAAKPQQFCKSQDGKPPGPQNFGVGHRGITARLRAPLLVALAAAALVASMILQLSVRANGDDADRCATFARVSAERAAADTGPTSGPRVAVIGDSFSVGLGLDRPARSWPARLPGRVHVDGFSGSGFSARASGCGPVSFADRAAAAVGGADLVVVEGGLNDVDRSDTEIRSGFERLMLAVGGRAVVVVGPPVAPARAGGVPRVDGLLADLAADHGTTYVPMSDLDLPYLDDRLHLTQAGHDAFGQRVAEAVGAQLR